MTRRQILDVLAEVRYLDPDTAKVIVCDLVDRETTTDEAITYQRDTTDDVRPLPAGVEGWGCTGRRAA